MCLKLTDSDVLSGVITTGFADDSEIPSYMKPYVSTALLTGLLSGYSNGLNEIVFNSGNYISYPEATLMLNNALNLTDESTVDYGDTVPAWAAQACANLSACRMSDYSNVPQLSRVACATLLYNTMNIIEEK